MKKLLIPVSAALALALFTSSSAQAQANTARGRAHRAASMRQAHPELEADEPVARTSNESLETAPKMLAYSDANKMASYPLFVSEQKTSHLVFPFPVTYVDLGSSGIIAAKATGAENIVRVKAGRVQFSETNMTVLTSDGKLYSFVVNYSRDPKVLNLDLADRAARPERSERSEKAEKAESSAAPERPAGSAILSNSPITQGNLDEYSQQSLTKKGSVASESANQLTLKAGQVGYRQETLFFPLHMTNKSNITYDIDFIKFYIQDKQGAKRTAEQAIEVQPIYVYNSPNKKIEADKTVDQVFIFKKFTIPDKKQLIVELYEKGGGRNIKVKLSNDDLLKAHAL
jgi:conjugative transposon TraN protein